MNVTAFTLNYPPTRRLGAEVAVHFMFRHLARQGHAVNVVRRNVRQADPYEHEGVTVHAHDQLDTWLGKADIVIYQAGLGSVLNTDAPTVAWAHSLKHGAIEDLRAKPPTLTIHNTHAQQAEADSGPSIVIHPPVDYRDWTAAPGDHITLVNPTMTKGAGLFYWLAAHNRTRRFLTVAGGYGKQKVLRLNNVQHLPHTADMNTVYARTRVLLMPSVRESWGMVAVEAAACGIPVIATDLPGPREALEDSALYAHVTDRAAWQAHLDTLNDPAEWARRSATARDRAVALDPTADALRFEAALLDLTNAGSPHGRS